MHCNFRYRVMLTVSMLILSQMLRLRGGEVANLWQLGQDTASVHRFSTLFTAHDVKNHLSTEEGRAKAMQWCRDTAVTRVFIETFRDGYEAEQSALVRARDDFKAAGFEVSGCVTTTQIGKPSSGWKIIACYTDPGNQDKVRQIFERTASLFDEIMIDDFWFTDCECPQCDAARRAKTVAIGTKHFRVPEDTWTSYRCELMVRLSQENVLGAARRINPNVKVIIKYPQWYDRFHLRGYEVLRETTDFNRIWVGTETRDFNDKQWGGTPQYEAYFIMRWLGEVGSRKCGGGWYDWLGTTEQTYVEQARQTVLAGAKESLLFCYGGLQGSTGPANIRALRNHIPDLQQAAAEIQKRRPVGLAAYKPASSNPEKEPRVFDFVGMLGIPLVPTHEFPTNAPAAFFSLHALSDPDFQPKFEAYVQSNRPVLVTGGLAKRVALIGSRNVHVLQVKDDPKSLLQYPMAELTDLRNTVLSSQKLRVEAPTLVGFYPFSDGSWVIENFNDSAVTVTVQEQTFQVGPRDWRMNWKSASSNSN